jgi:hypothetical protein
MPNLSFDPVNQWCGLVVVRASVLARFGDLYLLSNPLLRPGGHRLLALGVPVASQDLHRGDRPGPAPCTVHTPAPRRADGWPQSVRDGPWRGLLPPWSVSPGGWSSGFRGADSARCRCPGTADARHCTNTGQCGSSATRPPRLGNATNLDDNHWRISPPYTGRWATQAQATKTTHPASRCRQVFRGSKESHTLPKSDPARGFPGQIHIHAGQRPQHLSPATTGARAHDRTMDAP